MKRLTSLWNLGEAVTILDVRSRVDFYNVLKGNFIFLLTLGEGNYKYSCTFLDAVRNLYKRSMLMQMVNPPTS